ncbi:alpha/beta fold hydrolase [Nocardioides sp. GCM10027113]|uniref:alpha/beta fold hydrolase n=1 Tax=unclassified Nocardioides TaxID=2615069 RepID=UPI00361E7E37
MRASERHNVTVLGPESGQPMVFAHGYGCDQNMWRFVAPEFADDFRVVLFDWVGAGGSDLASYDPEHYSTLQAYADDLVELIRDLGLEDVVLVGHSVSATIGVLAEIAAPDLFDKLVLVGPSPCYIDDEGYRGGFTRADIEDLLSSVESNYLGWSAAIAPVIMGNPDRPELGQELTSSFCRTDPVVARQFARATFLTDHRADLPRVSTPTLVLQCRDDVIAPMEVGEFVHQQVPDSRLVVLDATGHCPNLSAPAATTAAIADFVRPGA